MCLHECKPAVQEKKWGGPYGLDHGVGHGVGYGLPHGPWPMAHRPHGLSVVKILKKKILLKSWSCIVYILVMYPEKAFKIGNMPEKYPKFANLRERG